MKASTINNHIERAQAAIDALMDIEELVGGPVVAPVINQLNHRIFRWQDELEATLCDCPYGGGVEVDPAEYRGADYYND